MAHQILLHTEVEPYQTIRPQLEALGEICQWNPLEPLPPAEVLRRIEGLYNFGHHRLDGAKMDLMPRLKVISNFGVGVDHIDLEAARQRGIPVANTPKLLDGATADMTFALLLAAARNLVRGDHFARSAAFTHYDPSFMLGQEVHGAVLGIVGLGSIGYQVARRALAFDMRVIYHNRQPRAQAAELGARYVPLDELLAQADFVTLNMPLTPQTRGMIGQRELALMKPTAVLVNAARGGVLDHQALYEALREGKIWAAGLDVTEPEPLPRNHPLLGLDNVIIMPHLGSATHQTRQAMAQRSVDNLRAGLEGKPLLSRVA
ncbi:MAG: D-glycerate dehydrogenase [Candidatus Handelsmanbacteria bacterium]|nr:D-glycerate dehydrogenase [Candidatus Handelsmanbacteria bacterium]